jgi:hypothetical protein
VIESRVGKATIVICLLVLAGLLVVRAPERNRRILHPMAAGLALGALYVAVRVKTWAPPPRTSIVGDVDEFIAAVPSHASEFGHWGAPRGFRTGMTGVALAECMWNHREEIAERWSEMLRPAVAAYGEAIRAGNTRAVWAKRRGDVVVHVPGRPWTRTWVARDVHDNVFSDV